MCVAIHHWQLVMWHISRQSHFCLASSRNLIFMKHIFLCIKYYLKCPRIGVVYNITVVRCFRVPNICCKKVGKSVTLRIINKNFKKYPGNSQKWVKLTFLGAHFLNILRCKSWNGGPATSALRILNIIILTVRTLN